MALGKLYNEERLWESMLLQRTVLESGGTSYDGHPTGWLHPKRGTLFKLQVYESVGISLLQLYESAGKSVISVCKKAQLC